LHAYKHDPEIHGVDGLGGVQGLPDSQSPEVLLRLSEARAIEAMPSRIREVWKDGQGEKVYIISTGPLTNIGEDFILFYHAYNFICFVALFVSAYPDLLDAVEEIVMMGGGVGMGNRSAVAGELIIRIFRLHSGLPLLFSLIEFNILVDRKSR
jgi:uridine nucleosidase